MFLVFGLVFHCYVFLSAREQEKVESYAPQNQNDVQCYPSCHSSNLSHKNDVTYESRSPFVLDPPVTSNSILCSFSSFLRFINNKNNNYHLGYSVLAIILVSWQAPSASISLTSLSNLTSLPQRYHLLKVPFKTVTYES